MKIAMNFPFILYPKLIENTITDEYTVEASELIFDRFYRKYEKNNLRKIIFKPISPSFDAKVLLMFRDINILVLICLVLAWWITVPVLIVILLIESFRYIKKYVAYLKGNKNYNRLLKLRNEYIDFHEFYFFVSKKFNKYLITADQELMQTKREIKSAKLEDLTRKILKPTKAIILQQKGISEIFFAEKLNDYFDFVNLEIITDYMVDNFFPDIVIRTNTGFYIDVEIDEPYVGNTKEIIHYYDPDSNYYCDEIRNNFFLESGWIVIRFSEKQIIKSSLSCCYEVALALANILDFDIPTDKVQERLLKETFWSRKIGEELVNSNYRNSYLPEELNRRFLS